MTRWGRTFGSLRRRAGQGRSDRVDPAMLSLRVFAGDVDLLARALGLGRFGLLGLSFGAFIATHHATQHGTARAI